VTSSAAGRSENACARAHFAERDLVVAVLG
jgi:hypothetical protein